MEAVNSDKDLLQINIMQAIQKCQTLKVGNRNINSSFKITTHRFLDFTDNKYEDGSHSYKMDSTIRIENSDGYIEDNCEIHFDAAIKGTDAEIINGLIIADKDFIPINFNLNTK
jgi:hypothetical protein